MSASQVQQHKQIVFDNQPSSQSAVVAHGIETLATQAYLTSLQNFPALQGQRTNLYKPFICQAWKLSNFQGICGMLHPKDVFDTENGDHFRLEPYPRLRRSSFVFTTN